MHFVETIIAYLRHAAGVGCFVTPGWQHLRRYQPGANHNRVPPARCSLHSPTTRNKPLHSIGTRPTTRNKSLHGIGTRPPSETNHCTASALAHHPKQTTARHRTLIQITASAFDRGATNKSLHCNARCSDLFVDILLSSSFIPL